MGIFNFLFGMVGGLFKKSGATAVAKLAEGLGDIAIGVVKELQNASDLTSEQKRKEAIARIKALAIAEGKKFSGHAVNLAIELALAVVTSAAAAKVSK